MDLISAEEVVRRISLYFQDGRLKYLTPSQRKAAERGIAASQRSDYDQQALNSHSAGMACERFIKTIPAYSGGRDGRGIVLCAGGRRYLTCAWVCINRLRRAGCRLPIELWHLGRREMDNRMAELLGGLGVKCVDASKVRARHPARLLNGWELKAYAILHSSFREVLLLDADNVAVVDPEFLFETPEYRATGAIFWPDREMTRNKATRPVWRSCGIRQPQEREFETGQIVVDKERCWRPLCLAMWLNENSDFYYQYVHGDKETFHLAFRKLRQRYALVQTPIASLQGTFCQHDFHGRRIFQHRNGAKWNLLSRNRRVKGFLHEGECLGYVRQLKKMWPEARKEKGQVTKC
jgi:hypothetical protein